MGSGSLDKGFGGYIYFIPQTDTRVRCQLKCQSHSQSETDIMYVELYPVKSIYKIDIISHIVTITNYNRKNVNVKMFRWSVNL